MKKSGKKKVRTKESIPTNESKTNKLIKKSIIEFAKRELNSNLAENDEIGCFPLDSWQKCADMDILAILGPHEYGGCDEDLMTTIGLIEALSYACKDSGLVHSVITQLCCLVQLSLFGSKHQKDTHLPPLISGKKIAAQAMTEPQAGSDLLALKTSATKNGDQYTLNGSKIFISNAPIADVFLVFAVTDPSRKKFGGISCFIVEKGTTGLAIGNALNKMGLRTLQNSELYLDDCRLTANDVVGKIGQGMVIFNEVIEWERLLFAAAHLGTMQRILEKCIEYVKARKQFGQPIGKFQSISNKIADIKINIELGKSILQRASLAKSNAHRITIEASIAKLFISESLKHACLEAVQIFGGYGFMKDFEIERDLRDSIASTIYSGTSEIHRNIITSMIGL